MNLLKAPSHLTVSESVGGDSYGFSLYSASEGGLLDV